MIPKGSLLAAASVAVFITSCENRATNSASTQDSVSTRVTHTDTIPALADSDLVIVPNIRFGPVTQFATEQELQSRFGVKQVRRTDVYVGEGESEPGTILFPGTMYEAEILWVGSYRCPKFVRTTPSATSWSIQRGIKVGATVAALEKANDSVFTFNGFDWDYGGYITDWGTGSMGNVYGRLDVPPNWKDRITQDEFLSIVGNIDVRSDNAVVRKLQPVLSQIIMAWPDSSAGCSK